MKAWFFLLLAGCGQMEELAWARPLETMGRTPAAQEFRLPLTDAGYRMLKYHGRWTGAGERLDIYFDLFQGGRFTLKYRPDPLKVRIKSRDEDSEWQISRIVSQTTVPALGLPIGVTRTEVWEGAFSNKDTRKLLERADLFFKRLPGGGSALHEAAQAVTERWPKTDWEGPGILSRFHVPADQLIPAATNRKTRLKAEWTVAGGRLDVVLGVTEAWDETGRRVLLYEVEAEPTGNATPQAFAESLRNAGLQLGHVAGKSPDAFVFTARQLGGHP